MSDIKDYTENTGVGDDLVSKDSLLKDFDDYTEALEFDQSYEGVPGGNIIFGGMQIKKKKYTDDTGGVWLGVDADGKTKLYLGDTTNYLKWDGTAIELYSNLTNALTLDYGSNVLLKEGGNLNFTSVVAPTACTAALAGAGAGNVDNGAHYYKVSYVNATGETELGTISNIVTVVDKTTNGKINLTSIPISSSGSVTARKIYRTKAGGTGYYLLTTISDNTTTTYTDNISDASLTGASANDMQNNSFGKLFVDSVASLNLGTTNSFIGQSSGIANTTGFNNTAFGYRSLYSNTTGYHNTAIGNLSTYSNTDGYYNTAVGYYSLYANTTGYSNVAVGDATLPGNTEGYRNTAIGSAALNANTTGVHNTAIGYASLAAVTTGSYNTAIGSSTLNGATGDSNTVIGYNSFLANTAGSNNIGLGYFAGRYETGSNAFYVDNQDRTNTAGDKAKAILYGIMAAAPANQKLTINGLLNQSVSKTPSSAADTGTAGDICWDANYIYVCVATDTWKRVAIATW